MKISQFVLSWFTWVCLCGCLAISAGAQDTLPKFSVITLGEKVLISWNNPYNNLVQLSVQRSYDSINRFNTLYSSLSPNLPSNGYTDQVAAGSKVFYRIFYVMEGGAYFFTKSMRASSKTTNSVDVTIPQNYDDKRDQIDEQLKLSLAGKKPVGYEIKPGQLFEISFRDTSSIFLNVHGLRSFRDSIIQDTKDTLFQLSESRFLLAHYTIPYEYFTSQYVFFDNPAYLTIKIPGADKKKYELLFYDEENNLVIEIGPITEDFLMMEKSNFQRSGWYKFELKEDGRVKERNKILVPKDF